MQGKSLVIPAAVLVLMATMCGSGGQGKGSAQATSEKEVALLDENFPPMSFPPEWPAPAARPAGPPPEAAAALAKRALAGGPDTLAVLERVALDSGFAIHDQSGKYLYTPAPEVDNGMSIQDLDLVTAAEGLKRKAITTYGDLRAQAELEEPTKDFPLEKLLSGCSVEGSGHPKGPNPGRAFMTDFLMELSQQSDGLYDLPADWSPDTGLSSGHVCFILYTAMAAAYVGSLGKDAASIEPKDDNMADGVPPAEEPPAEDPPVEEPPTEEPPPVPDAEEPPHGPRVTQLNAANAAFRNLRQVVTNFSNDQIAGHIRNNRRNLDAHAVLLLLARRQAIKSGVSLKLQVHGQPLVRTKTFGQTGEKRGLSVIARFEVSDDFRNRYEALRQYVRRGGPLPPNGFLECDVYLKGDDLVKVDPSALSLSGTGTVERTMVIGARQDKKLPSLPKEDDKTAYIYARVQVEELVATGRKLQLPVRDWLPGGMWLKTAVYVDGNGVETTQNGGTFRWYIHRYLKQRVVLESEFPAPMLGGAYDASNPDRYMSWMTNIDPTKPIEAEYEYVIDDMYISEGPAGGCGVKDGERAKSVMTVRERKPPQDLFRQDVVSWDTLKNTYSFRAALLKLPATITRDDSEPFDIEMSVLEEIKPNPNLAVQGTPVGSAFELDTNVLNVLQMQKTGGARYMGEAEVPTRIGRPRYATVQATWELAERNPKAGAKKASLSAAEVMALMVRPSQDSRRAPILSHLPTPPGQLWTMHDANAATCSEIVLADALPTSIAR